MSANAPSSSDCDVSDVSDCSSAGTLERKPLFDTDASPSDAAEG